MSGRETNLTLVRTASNVAACLLMAAPVAMVASRRRSRRG